MTDKNRIDWTSLIKDEINSREVLIEHLSKAKAMIHVALNGDFLNFEKLLINDYLWALSDLIERASRVNEQSLNSLLRQSRQKNLD
jgi:hypothetical protein